MNAATLAAQQAALERHVTGALGRGGAASHAEALGRSGSLGTIRAALAHSGEASSGVQALSRRVLGREASAFELSSLLDSLAGGLELSGVAAVLPEVAEEAPVMQAAQRYYELMDYDAERHPERVILNATAVELAQELLA